MNQHFHRISLSLAFVFVVGISGIGCPEGCKTPPTLAKILDCTGPAIQQYGIPLIPKVNNCLTGGLNWTICLIGLISPAAGITEEIIACVVRDQGGKFAQTADDALENKGACRADNFITERKYEFADGYRSPENIDPGACE